MTTPPVLVLGMHRSGTSMVVRALRDMGLFTGWLRDPNDEATFFLKLNAWLLRQCGGAWDHPEVIDDVLCDASLRRVYAEALKQATESPRAASYLGPLRYVAGARLSSFDQRWGWKDPRTTFTLPLWSDVFPDLRIVHVVRHGLDVALSLRARVRRRTRHGRSAQRPLRWISGRFPKRREMSSSPRCASIRGGISLWHDYVSRAHAHVECMGARAFEIRYEDLVDDPTTHYRDLARFCGLHPTPRQVKQCAQAVQSGKTGAYKKRDALDCAALCELPESDRDACTALLQTYGYDV